MNLDGEAARVLLAHCQLRANLMSFFTAPDLHVGTPLAGSSGSVLCSATPPTLTDVVSLILFFT